MSSTDKVRVRLTGYGERPPRVEWPGGARLALTIALNYEEGAEPNLLLGDPEREQLTEAAYAVVPTERELMHESTYEYGSRVGHWRVIQLLDEYGFTCSVFAAARALELNPELTQAFVRREYDMVGHGYRWVGHFGMTESEERKDIRDCIQTIQRLTGQTIGGWFQRPPATVHTRRIAAEEGIFFDNTATNDDIPYYDEVGGRQMLIVPYTLDANDIRFWRERGFVTARQFFEYLRDAFSVLYKESGRTPRLMSVGLHGRIIGRPGRLPGLERFLDHVQSFRDVWVASRSDVATIWAQQFAPPDTWNWPRRPGGPTTHQDEHNP